MNRRTFMTTLFAGVVTPGLLPACKPQANVETLYTCPEGMKAVILNPDWMVRLEEVRPRTAGHKIKALTEQGQKLSVSDETGLHKWEMYSGQSITFRPAAGSPEKTQRK